MMVVVLLGILLGSLALGMPMLFGLLASSIVVLLVYFPQLAPGLLMQQIVVGISSSVLLAVPMFILAAEIMCAGESGNRLFGAVRALLGHLRGGVAIASVGSCTLFGAISGSTQATLVAVGRPMYVQLMGLGYGVSHALGLLMCSANIALLIPPSICMIMYAVMTGASVAKLFIAGVMPGLLLFFLFSIYEAVIAKKKNIPLHPVPAKAELLQTLRRALLPLGFPVLILGGIYAGIFSPTEAAAVACLYAFVLEAFVYRSLKWKDFYKIALSTGTVTATVFILVAAGQAFSWILSYAGIPQALASSIVGPDTSKLMVLVTIAVFFFIACMFVDSIPVILILTPIFYRIALAVGIDPIHLGILVTLQSAIGCVTPPFGCNIFTAAAIFDKPYSVVVRGLMPYILIFVLATVLIIVFPQISLFLSELAFQ